MRVASVLKERLVVKQYVLPFASVLKLIAATLLQYQRLGCL